MWAQTIPDISVTEVRGSPNLTSRTPIRPLSLFEIAQTLGPSRDQSGSPSRSGSAARNAAHGPQLALPIEGASGPQPHPNFIEVSRPAPVRGGPRAVAGAGEDRSALSV